jgi:catechol 2,3-dioxygenase-like lactoylglutathione lyase family enzyme
MLDHIGFAVADLARSRKFYAKALAPLGYIPVMDLTAEQTGGYAGTGFGPPSRPQFWIGNGEQPGSRVHIAFVAKSRAEVDAFHKAALAAGGRDNGAPGLRPHYHEHYYGAFVVDPDGHNVEAVCHTPGS